jgi:hypothetical protein
MFRAVLPVITVGVLVVAATAPRATSGSAVPCATSVVHYDRYPGTGRALGRAPWVRASPISQGLVGLLAYWTDEWRAGRVTTAQMYAGGTSPVGGNMKILWAFLAPKARTATDAQLLTVKGKRLDAPGKSWQRFHPISYTGQNRAPSFASVIDLPSPGCWRLDLTAGSLHGTTTFLALAVRP